MSQRMLRSAQSLCAVIFCVASLASVSPAAENAPKPDPRAKGSGNSAGTSRKKLIPMKTFGGRQFWGDLVHFHGYRIQKSPVYDNAIRLLDPDNYRIASGTLAECTSALEEIKRQKQLKPMTGKAVIMLHGIVRSSRSFDRMGAALTKAGYVPIGFDYPSTRVSIPDSAEFLHSVIDHLDGVEEINFVVHSMGGLIVRSYLSKHQDKRIKRMVMLGVPNNGANLANMFQNNLIFKAVLGPAGQQLIEDQNGLIAKLPVPKFEFAVVAGGKNNDKGYNPLIPGDDDAVVAVESTRLPGASDFAVIDGMHSFLAANSRAIEMSANFFKTGQLHEVGGRHPIPAE